MRIQIQILSWAKHKPRKNYSQLEWIKLYVRVLHDKKLHGATYDVMWTWVGLLIVAAEENKDGKIDAEEDWVAEELRLRKSDFLRNVVFLQSRGLLSVDTTSGEVSPRNFEKLKLTSKSDLPERERRKREEKEREEGERGTFVPGPPSPSDLIQIWNDTADSRLARVRSAKVVSGSQRHKHAQARLADEPNPDYWRQVVARINASSFCLGSNDRGWLADFDWLIKPETHLKVLEGKYYDRDPFAETQAANAAWAKAMDEAASAQKATAEPPPSLPPPPPKTPEQLEEERKKREAQLAEMRRIRLTQGGHAS